VPGTRLQLLLHGEVTQANWANPDSIQETWRQVDGSATMWGGAPESLYCTDPGDRHRAP